MTATPMTADDDPFERAARGLDARANAIHDSNPSAAAHCRLTAEYLRRRSAAGRAWEAAHRRPTPTGRAEG